MRRLAIAAAAVLVLAGCARDTAVVQAPESERRDIPLGPPRYRAATETTFTPAEYARRRLQGTGVFSFARESEQIESLRFVMAGADAVEVLRTIGQGADVAGQLYAWCGLLSLAPQEAAAIRSRLARRRAQVTVFDANLHHRQTTSWVVRRASESGFCAGLAPVQAVDPWIAAERSIVRLRPSAFPDVPRIVRDDLERRGCRIPQVPDGARWQNIVTGRFTAPRVLDWAALCSRSGESSIVVYPGGEPRHVLEFARASDKDYLQQDVDAIVFSRQIGVATPALIRVKNHPSIVPGLPRFDHDGIDDAFVEKASTIWFRTGSRWIKLLGAD